MCLIYELFDIVSLIFDLLTFDLKAGMLDKKHLSAPSSAEIESSVFVFRPGRRVNV